jgi:hypothetical protein
MLLGLGRSLVLLLRNLIGIVKHLEGVQNTCLAQIPVAHVAGRLHLDTSLLLGLLLGELILGWDLGLDVSQRVGVLLGDLLGSLELLGLGRDLLRVLVVRGVSNHRCSLWLALGDFAGLLLSKLVLVLGDESSLY